MTTPEFRICATCKYSDERIERDEDGYRANNGGNLGYASYTNACRGLDYSPAFIKAKYTRGE